MNNKIYTFCLQAFGEKRKCQAWDGKFVSTFMIVLQQDVVVFKLKEIAESFSDMLRKEIFV